MRNVRKKLSKMQPHETESHRVYRRLFSKSQATMAGLCC